MASTFRGLTSPIVLILFFASSIYSFAAEPTPKGKGFNPDTSLNFLGLWQRGTGASDVRTDVPHNGFSLQEAELQLSSDVDPYLRAQAPWHLRKNPAQRTLQLNPKKFTPNHFLCLT